MGSCQNEGPFLGTINSRCRILLRTPKRDPKFDNHPKGSRNKRVVCCCMLLQLTPTFATPISTAGRLCDPRPHKVPNSKKPRNRNVCKGQGGPDR